MPGAIKLTTRDTDAWRQTTDAVGNDDDTVGLITPLPDDPKPPTVPRPTTPRPVPRAPRPVPTGPTGRTGPTGPTVPDDQGPVNDDTPGSGDPSTVTVFPVLDRFLPEALRVKLGRIADALEDGILQENPSTVIVGGSGVAVTQARTRLLGFLRRDAIDAVKELVFGEDGVIKLMLRREFIAALGKIGDITEFGGGSVSEATIHSALTTAQTEYLIDIGPGPNIRRVVPGYAGPKVTTTERFALSDLSELVGGGPERDFHLELLRAECSTGLHNYSDALIKYERLRKNTDLSLARRRFVAIRGALAHLARGDETYRANRNPNAKKRRAIIADYDAAVTVMTSVGVSPTNQTRRHVELYAAAQKAKLAAGFNALGFKDSYVPVLSREELRRRAEDRIVLAGEARTRYLNFRQLADDLTEKRADLLLEQEIAAISLEIANERIELSDDQEELATTRREIIEDGLDDLLEDQLLSATPAVLQAAATAAFTGEAVELVKSVEGITSAAIGYFSRGEELRNQLKIADIEVAIAGREKAIAELEQDIAEARQRSVGERLDSLSNRILNAELFYAMSNLYEDMAERNLEAAIRWAYLYERAVAFHRLTRQPPIIELDYREEVEGRDTLIPAPEQLTELLIAVREADAGPGDSQILEDNPISLRTSYPIEFSQFLQNGEMDFAISLYDIDKARPGVFHRRLMSVQVQVTGSIPRTGFRGQIIHRGFFALRDDKATLGPPPVTRLLPTEEEVDRALEDLQNGNIQGDPVGGVLLFLVDEDIQQLSAAEQPQDNNPEATAVALFEAYGETGNWHLEIEGIDLRLITDVLVTFTIAFPETNPVLAAKVNELVAAYEEEQIATDGLDKTALFSLRQRFPDTFFDLESGTASFVLEDSDFPPDFVDRRVKAIIGQVVDADGVGVEGIGLEFAKVGTSFTVARTTSAGGFSEPMDEPIVFVEPPEARVPAEGTWQVRLPAPADFARIDDLRVFIIYSYRPRD
jgi:Tc toxin complex TcA C-terminal TcB-binding domain